MSTIQFLLDSQEKFQLRMGNNFKEMSQKEKSTYIKEHGYFLIEEVTEMIRELPYHKSWKDYSGLSGEEILAQEQLAKEEAIDALHFMINILLSLGMDEKEIIEMYKDKNKLNYERQVDADLGYIQEALSLDIEE